MKKQQILAVILIAKSGSGKGTIAQALLDLDSVEYKKLALSVSDTTRPQKNGEIDGVHYNFIAVNEFKIRARLHDAYLEWEMYAGNLYGSPKDQFNRNFEQGKITLYDVEPNGARKLVEKIGREHVKVFHIVVPDDQRKERVKQRARDSEEEQIARDLDDNKRFDDSLSEFATTILYLDGSVAGVTANLIYNELFQKATV